MNYYIVSEAELERLSQTSFECGNSRAGDKEYEAEEKAEAACRARVVPEWATHWLHLEDFVHERIEEIKR
jgi:hypothetical protein